MRELDIQNQIRIAMSPYGTFFRANAGQGWQGKIIEKSEDILILQHPQPFYGLPIGFPDLFGFLHGTPLFCGVEVKTPTGRIRPEQEHMIKFLLSKGCLAGVARSPEDAIRIVKSNGS